MHLRDQQNASAELHTTSRYILTHLGSTTTPSRGSTVQSVAAAESRWTKVFTRSLDTRRRTTTTSSGRERHPRVSPPPMPRHRAFTRQLTRASDAARESVTRSSPQIRIRASPLLERECPSYPPLRHPLPTQPGGATTTTMVPAGKQPCGPPSRAAAPASLPPDTATLHLTTPQPRSDE